MTIHVCAPCFYPTTEPLDLLRKSCEHFNIELFPYGVGMPWRSHWNAKIYSLFEHLQVIRDEYSVVLDGTDMLCVRGDLRVVEILCKDHVYVGASKGLWPLTLTPEEFPDNRTGYKYVNVGLIAGRTVEILRVLHSIKSREHEILFLPGADQEGWARAYQRNACVLDQDCRLMQMVSDMGYDDIEVQGGEVMNKRTQTYPLFLHYAGRISGREEMARTLGIL